MPLTRDQCVALIRSLLTNRSAEGSGRFDKLHNLIGVRQQHFFNLKKADQQLGPPHEGVAAFQTDVLRRTWSQARARMTEHPFRIRVIAPSPGKQGKADDIEAALNRGFELAAERAGIDILGNLADGQWVEAFGVLHWQIATDIWPDFPQPEFKDELEDGDDKRFREREDSDPEGGRFVERDTSRQERNRQAKASAGFPILLETPYPDTVAYIADRSMENGFGAFVRLQEVPLIEFDQKLQQQDQKRALLRNLNGNERLSIQREQEAPADGEPSMMDAKAWGTTIVVAGIWTRDHFYELANAKTNATGTGDGWVEVKDFAHAYGMPPFAFAEGDHFNHPDPALRHTPALTGVYRIKPFFDHDMTLGRAIAEQIALPLYFIQMEDGSFMVGNDGKQLVLSKNALAAMTLPPGAKIVAVAPELNPAMIEFLRFTNEEMAESVPETGFVDISASTQPWTIRLGQAQSNTPIAMYKRNAARAIRTAARNIVELIADENGIGQPVPVMMADGEIKVIDPKDLEGMTIEVDIDATSDAQRVANIEHARQLAADPNVPFTENDMIEVMGIEDGDDKIEEATAERWYKQFVMPGFFAQQVAMRFGGTYVVGPDGSFTGADGQQAGPEEVLQSQGIQAERQPELPDIAPLAVNGAEPVPGGGV